MPANPRISEETKALLREKIAEIDLLITRAEADVLTKQNASQSAKTAYQKAKDAVKELQKQRQDFENDLDA